MQLKLLTIEWEILFPHNSPLLAKICKANIYLTHWNSDKKMLNKHLILREMLNILDNYNPLQKT